MDQELFRFLGTDQAEFARRAQDISDAEIERWVQDSFLSKKTQREIEEWNASWVNHGPDPGSESERHFLGMRDTIAPVRTDVHSWADLLDLDEGRVVPQRRAA
jgi:hypothetical protein